MILAGGQQLPHSGTVVTRWQCCVGFIRRLCVRVCASACLPVFLCCCSRMHLLYFTQPLTLFFFSFITDNFIIRTTAKLVVCVCLYFILFDYFCLRLSTVIHGTRCDSMHATGHTHAGWLCYYSWTGRIVRENWPNFHLIRLRSLYPGMFHTNEFKVFVFASGSFHCPCQLCIRRPVASKPMRTQSL